MTGAVGWWFGWTELTIPALAAIALLAVGLLMALGSSRYEVELDAERMRVAVGTEATVSLWVTNASRRRALPSTLRIGMGDGTIAVRVPALAAGARRELE
ncbi:MAG: hypothetical protein LBR19_09630, partial [Bifidobacteriaceae bacterium]|nr:hypothetical protein [Bifidobacteriaceae bacterium]